LSELIAGEDNNPDSGKDSDIGNNRKVVPGLITILHKASVKLPAKSKKTEL